MSAVFCILGTSVCLPLDEWKDISQIAGTLIAIAGALIAATKTFKEIEKIRKEKARERLSQLHQLQLGELGKLYSCLEKVQAYAQLMTQTAIFEGENIDEYPSMLAKSMTKAREVFVSSRLYLPPHIVTKVEAFFQKAVEGQIFFGTAQRIAPPSQERAEYWKRAATNAHKDMPLLLAELEQSARKIIHVEEN